MSSNEFDEIAVLKLTLHDRLVGYLLGYKNGKNILYFADDFKNAPKRPTFSLITHPSFPRATKLMNKEWIRNHRIHPTLSNLLPEGSMRELITQQLKVHIDNEFSIFSYLGKDLPGALITEPMEPDDVPRSIFTIYGKAKTINLITTDLANKFSLAGVQMKFSMKEKEGRYNISKGNVLGDWIVKTPSTKHKDVPANEFTAMTLAQLVGINIPQIKLVELTKLNNLPQINLPNEEFAFAIKRFDRERDTRIHMEDFAQVLAKYPHDKYNSANHEQIAKILYEYSGDGLVDAQQFARRLLVNILLANGDAHIKNWSLVYSDRVTPRLSPAYDIVTTSVYIDEERHYALNLGKNKDWYKATYEHFARWAKHADIPWRAIKPHLNDVIEKARHFWPEELKNLPMNETQKKKLQNHWKKLHKDFRIE